MRIAIALLAACTLLVGCGGSANVVGKYKGKVELPKDDKNPLGAGMAEAFASSMTLEIKADKTFAMSMIFPIEGSWAMSGSTLTLTPKSMAGMSPPDNATSDGNKPMEFDVSADGKTLTAKGGKPGDGELTFIRE